MSHTNNWAKNDPYVAEIAAKVDEILKPYESVLGNVQVPFTVGKSMVNAHARGERSKFENELYQYNLFLGDNNPYDRTWKWTKMYFDHKDIIKEKGAQSSSWLQFVNYVKKFLDIYLQRDTNSKDKRSWHNIQVVYYSLFD